MRCSAASFWHCLLGLSKVRSAGICLQIAAALLHGETKFASLTSSFLEALFACVRMQEGQGWSCYWRLKRTAQTWRSPCAASALKAVSHCWGRPWPGAMMTVCLLCWQLPGVRISPLPFNDVQSLHAQPLRDALRLLRHATLWPL